MVSTVGTNAILIGLAGSGFDIAVRQRVGGLDQTPRTPFGTVFDAAVDLVAGGLGDRTPFQCIDTAAACLERFDTRSGKRRGDRLGSGRQAFVQCAADGAQRSEAILIFDAALRFDILLEHIVQFFCCQIPIAADRSAVQVTAIGFVRPRPGQDRLAEFVQRRCVRRRCRGSVETLRVKKADFVTDRFFETCDIDEEAIAVLVFFDTGRTEDEAALLTVACVIDVKISVRR